ncbi:MAG: cytochrome c oxidase subunit 3 family protein [Desulfamplus sp.]|nr:cytochrome c oxidase subunit 3 family protein [Desulfamplus sp.]MBF0211065.1 cytochrome c oxidase subunit 3 family protein [Desulfamplus sp.]MBF0242530.1 cytochrome c oxidase subunit 3 family protein [Desulfamplus sp.]MBF0390029.1 cytochrome c oxidase subunit 3 family protein [Desulfamplus sp.]
MSINHTDNKPSDAIGSRTGMWLFLYTEIMLFGGLFVLYAAYYRMYTADFTGAGKELDLIMGAVNTVILLVSSFAVAASITAIQQKSKKIALAFLGFAIFLGFVFLVNKYFEWGHKIDLGIFPNSPVMADSPHGRVLFFSLYYTITGLHGIHIIIGMTLLTVVMAFIMADKITAQKYVFLENAGLYWHLVDLIWIFIFPLFYLIY